MTTQEKERSKRRKRLSNAGASVLGSGNHEAGFRKKQLLNGATLSCHMKTAEFRSDGYLGAMFPLTCFTSMNATTSTTAAAKKTPRLHPSRISGAAVRCFASTAPSARPV